MTSYRIRYSGYLDIESNTAEDAIDLALEQLPDPSDVEVTDQTEVNPDDGL